MLNSTCHANCASCTCTATAASLNFGNNYNPLTGNLDQSIGTFMVNCTSLTPINQASYSIALNSGVDSQLNPRILESGNQDLNYNLYTDASYTQIWGDGTSGTSVVTFNHCTSSEHSAPYTCSHTFSIYGKIPGSQLAVIAERVYTNIITITLNY